MKTQKEGGRAREVYIESLVRFAFVGIREREREKAILKIIL